MGNSGIPRSPHVWGHEHRVREFLDRAAPIVFAGKELDADSRSALEKLAAAVGLSSVEFEDQMRALEQRGVFGTASAEPAVERPEVWDLPGTGTAADPAADVATETLDADSRARLDQFFRHAAPLVARYRGVHGSGRTALEALARQLGLANEVLAEAMTALEGACGGQELGLSTGELLRREAYRAHVRRVLAKLHIAMVTGPIQRRLIEAAGQCHGVPAGWVQPIINQVAFEMGMRLVSDDEARRRVRTLVARQLDGGEILDVGTRSHIYSEGTAWGLSPMEVEWLIVEQLRERIRCASLGHTRFHILLALGTLILFGCTALGAWLIWLTRLGR